MDTTLRIGIIGGGQMGTALVKGILHAGVADASEITVSDVIASARERLHAESGVRTTNDNTEAAKNADVVVIALKPQVAAEALEPVAGKLMPTQTVLSIMAGVPTGKLERWLSGDDEAAQPVHVVRAMPNTPALIGEGMAAISRGAHAKDADMNRAERILAAVGRVVRVDEKQLDAVTGLSGSGPGYVYTVIEALADGGVKVGLPKPLALELAAQTVLGAARMVLETEEHPAVLRDRVTSPGGTTIAGLHAMEAAGIRNALMQAVEAAARRSRELGE
ncbi:MAG TPA: pyrroline-5-carboxylate reductase [Candidatus Latescibacteria bacterium]|nr:pyrroline-5-carboxylate reductase [Candidatus Latescibacterota bacterium]HOS63362.1 pyrroline-5-carboxylate reductase [Candidatus Latescibacterota bacterium]HPK75415.1 pyrroline-5-carboxylate reductase [Candidatus Latescibacterota bacterium]